MKSKRSLSVGLALSALCALGQADVRNIANETLDSIFGFEGSSALTVVNGATAAYITSWHTEGSQAIQVVYSYTDQTTYPEYYKTFSTNTNWTNAGGMAVDVHNPYSTSVKVNFVAASANGKFVGNFEAPAGYSTLVLPLDVTFPAANTYGMATLPPLYLSSPGQPVVVKPKTFGPQGASFDRTNVTKVRLTLDPSTVQNGPINLEFDNIRRLNPINDSSWLSGLVDKYGQFTGRTYNGKTTTDSDLTSQYTSEHSALTSATLPTGRDIYGGSTTYTTTATGNFRTFTDTAGKRWLIDPLGGYFFSIGANVIMGKQAGATMTDQTYRPNLFLNLPATNDANYSRFYTANDSGSLTGFTTGTTYNHFYANVFTKYGGPSLTTTDPWATVKASYYAEANLRMKVWGLNTVGGWCADDNLATPWVKANTMPYTVAVGSLITGGGVNTVAITGRTPVPDPYDPNFATNLVTKLGWTMTSARKGDPYLIGYYVDNELGWRAFAGNSDPNGGPYALIIALLKQTNTPCKIAFKNQLVTKYGTIANLNSQWGTTLSDWSAFLNPVTISATTAAGNSGMTADFSAFLSAYATLYFQTVKEKVHAGDPNHLYLGCRFATRSDMYNFTDEVLLAAGAQCDVVTFNYYGTSLTTDLASKFNLCAAPILISECAIQATDQDHWGATIIPQADSQSNRASMTASFFDSLASNANVVGIHWFKWEDDAVAGQPWEGENWNMGLVSITDRPYSDLTSVFFNFNSSIFTTHGGEMPGGGVTPIQPSPFK